MVALETLHWVHARKSQYCCEGIPKGDPGEHSEREKQRDGEKASIFLENT